MDWEMSDEELIALADEAEAQYREREGTPTEENFPVENRGWSQNAQDWLDDYDLDIPELNEGIQYGEGRRPRPKVPLFEVIDHFVREYINFETTGTCYNLKIADPYPKVVPEKWLRELLESIISHFKNNSSVDVRPGDRIGMSLKNAECGTDPVYISIRRADQLSVEVILEHVMNIFDSNKSFFLNGHLTVHFDHIRMDHGSGDRITRKFGQSNVDFINKKACFLKYKNPSKNNLGDEYCLPYALVLGRAYNQFKCGKGKRYVYEKYQINFRELRKAAKKLCREADVKMSELRGGCSFDEVKKFQRILPNYQIVIYNRDSTKPIYTDPRYSDKIKLNIMLHDNHYNAMRSVQACFGAKYICPDCNTHTRTEKIHSCKYSCILCHSKPICKVTKDTIECKKCNRNFYGPECFKNHLKVNKNQSVCMVKKNCPKCKSTLEKKHICGKRKCFTCEKMVDKGNHLCHMPIYVTKRDPDSNYLYVMYDFETQQNTILNEIEPNKFKHVPNLCVSQSQCSKCINDSDISTSCHECGVREYIYDSTECVVELMEYLISKSEEKVERIIEDKIRKVPRFDKIILIAHNSSGFDAQFILKYIYDSDRFGTPDIIMNGTKIIELKLGSRIKFIDSLLYFQKPLADLPELFGFEGVKGTYPHLFNTPSNNNHVGVGLPAKSFYSYDSMKPDQRDMFDKWYDSMPGDYVFDDKKELIEYCRMDVTILRKACMKFVKSFWEENQIDPFLDASTMAGACNRVFRSNYLKEDTIGVIPTNGYRLAENQSKDAIKWMTNIELEENIEIHHAGRGREYTIPGVGRCDGYHAPTNTIFEYHGCYWHFHTCLSNNHDDNPFLDYMMERRDATLAKEKAIRDAGYNLVVMRECEFKREMEENPAVNTLLNHHPMVANDPLIPRDAFYGGRTNANKLYFKSDGKTKLFYSDICSLYPYINETAKSIISHPTVHVGDACHNVPWMEMDGLMKVTVSPPRNLDFPVLPARYHKRLMFVLCNTCAINLNKSKCKHNKIERQITGTWVMDEVKLAVSKGYEIVKIHEIWEYEVTQYDPKTNEGGFFSGYINHFLKIKTQAGGYPKWCKTSEQQETYIKDFYAREGILLDRDKIEKNPPLRSMSKLMLNSFWGRFGMRPDLLRTKVVQDERALRDMVLSPHMEIHSILPINDEKMLVNYRVKEVAREPNNTTNVVLAAFTTAYARMELYKYLEMLGPERVFYYDTDSIIASFKEGEVMPELGDYLGQMTDELEPGCYIIEFVSGGPKNYAYKVYSPDKDKITVVVKVKGITLNYENSQLLNFDMMKSMVLDPAIKPLELNIDGIRRTHFNDVYSTRVKKSYRINYTKRQLNGTDYSTIPYGY